MSDFSTPPWCEEEPKICECGGYIVDNYCADCGASYLDEELHEYEYLTKNYDL